MSQENNSRFAILATLLSFGVVGGISLLLWALSRQADRAVQVNPQSTSIAANENLPQAVTSRISLGEQSLFPQPSEDKVEGIEAIAQGNFANAVTVLNASLAEDPNDPETFIYRNNARIGDRDAYTIAVVAPAGDTSNIGLEILRGAAQAQDDINRNGGINSTPVQLILVDDENSTTVARSLAESLIGDPSVLGVVGHYSSDVTLATAPIYAEGELVTITPVSKAVDLSGVSPYLYRTVPSDSFAAAALSAYMLYYRDDRQAAVYYDSNSELSNSLKEEFNRFVNAWGGDTVAEYDLSSTTFTPELQADAEERGADILMIAASASTLPQAAAAIEFNDNRLPILGGDELYNRMILSETGSAAQALTVAVPWHILSRDSEVDFVRSSRDLWEGDVNWRTAATYDAVMAIAMGLVNEPSRAGLKAALDDTDFTVDSATGPINFLPSGDRRQVDRLVQVEPGTRSGAGYDFVPFTLDRDD